MIEPGLATEKPFETNKLQENRSRDVRSRYQYCHASLPSAGRGDSKAVDVRVEVDRGYAMVRPSDAALTRFSLAALPVCSGDTPG
jgi:hypothetical protein